jgi:hypothetical protein
MLFGVEVVDATLRIGMQLRGPGFSSTDQDAAAWTGMQLRGPRFGELWSLIGSEAASRRSGAPPVRQNWGAAFGT